MGPLAAILVVSAVVIGLGLDTRSVGDLASISGGWPEFHIPMVPLNLETLEIILPYSIILAAIGLIESLLTLNLVGEIAGMGGCAMIGQSMINVNSGGRTRLSGITAAVF